MSQRIAVAPFGTLADGSPVSLYTLVNAHGLVAKITNYGGIVTELHTPDRAGALGDIVLGFDNLEAYLAGHPYFGALIGRVGNRIDRARFSLDGRDYALAPNDTPHSLHGGAAGFDKKVWTATSALTDNGPALTLTYVSHDGEEGYPGTLTVTAVYTLTNDDTLAIDYTATTDARTPVNLTNHSYFNLGLRGHHYSHVLSLAAARFTPVDDTLIPTGDIVSVAGTPLDFTAPTAIGARIASLTGEPGGYDHNFVLDAGGGELALAARVCEPVTGRTMEVWTTEPGIQFYSGNFLDGSLTGKGGVVYAKHTGFCLETQHYPDSINQPNFPSIVLSPGEVYRTTTVHRFGVA